MPDESAAQTPEQAPQQDTVGTQVVETPEPRADGSRTEEAETRAQRDARFERDACPSWTSCTRLRCG